MMTNLELQVQAWHENVYGKTVRLPATYRKLLEEVGELGEALMRQDPDAIREEAGDVGLVLTHLLAFQEGNPVCFAQLPALVAVQRPLWRKLQDLAYRNFHLIPLENQGSTFPQHPEALGKSIAQFFPPVSIQHAVTLRHIPRCRRVQDMWGVKNHVVKCPVWVWQFRKTPLPIWSNNHRSPWTVGVFSREHAAPLVYVQRPLVLLVKPERPTPTARIEHRRKANKRIKPTAYCAVELGGLFLVLVHGAVCVRSVLEPPEVLPAHDQDPPKRSLRAAPGADAHRMLLLCHDLGLQGPAVSVRDGMH